jgi:hypothetical protein
VEAERVRTMARHEWREGWRNRLSNRRMVGGKNADVAGSGVKQIVRRWGALVKAAEQIIQCRQEVAVESVVKSDAVHVFRFVDRWFKPSLAGPRFKDLL